MAFLRYVRMIYWKMLIESREKSTYPSTATINFISIVHPVQFCVLLRIERVGSLCVVNSVHVNLAVEADACNHVPTTDRLRSYCSSITHSAPIVTNLPLSVFWRARAFLSSNLSLCTVTVLNS